MRSSPVQTQKPFDLPCIDRSQAHYTEFNGSFGASVCGESGFELGLFLARYWCGDSALREDRKVSRKRLMLQQAGVDNQDQSAQRLFRQLQAYRVATKLVLDAESISLDLLSRMNELLNAQHSKSGILRTIQNYIGDPLKPRYVGPHPDRVLPLMQDLINFCNDDSIDLTARAITTHSQLLAIHPFHDGNGRTARALMDAMLAKAHPGYLSFSLNRLRNDREYIKAICQFGIDGSLGLRHPYWLESIAVIEEFKKTADKHIKYAVQRMKASLAPFGASKDVYTLCRLLWNQPIILSNNLPETASWDDRRFVAAIEVLVRAGILTLRRLAKPEGVTILDCPLVFRTWQVLDDLVFAHEAGEASANLPFKTGQI